ncbi:MAG TPA: TRC40/GET3/ArsA family transport-energizing ATPase [Desulfobacteria bacterium]|nr:TRC40/GET3/ArsA family transport-energizing ATPase [Desulfobacteria bacterium]
MRVIFYTGKGGAGKSVISCATALKLSERGYKTLIISSDPAHTLSDALETVVHHRPTAIVDKLWAVQIDPIREARESYGVIQEYVVNLFKSRGVDEVLAYEIAALPNMTEFVSLLKLVEYVESNSYDVIVLDTVPSGDALKNIYLPTILGSTASKVIKLVAPLANIAKLVEPIVGIPTPGKEVIKQDIKLLEVLSKLKTIIADRKVTSLRLIANPEAFSIQNLKRTYLLANLYDINVDLAVMNKIIPDDVSDAYFKEWKAAQEKYLAESESAFHPLPLKKLRLFQSEVKGLELLSAVGDELFNGEDPAQIYYEGKAIRVEEIEGGLEVIVPLPTAGKYKEVCEVERMGEDLSVVISTDIGEARNFIPLPAIAHLMKLDKAKLLNADLHIYFTDERWKKERK